MKISGTVEQIFAHAVALDQNGGLRNSIYAEGREVFIMNYDHTVLLRFRLRDTETPFENPISFKANDYDSNEFSEEDGKAEQSPSEIKELVSAYLVGKKSKQERESITIDKSILSLLDQDLSHIEFSGKKGGVLKMIQRNIYSGGIVEISEKVDGMFANTLKKDFGPIGVKTKDFEALFTFQDTLKFEFPNAESEDFMIVRSIDKKKRDMVGIIAMCLYDEIITIQESRK